MADNQWGEIFNLTEELKRIEDEVDRRLEETLAEDPHVIEQETVHYGAAAAAADRAEEFRMRQSVPLFGDVGVQPAPEPHAQDIPVEDVPAEDGQEPQGAMLDPLQNSANEIWNEAPVEDYVTPLAAALEEDAGAPADDGEERVAEDPIKVPVAGPEAAEVHWPEAETPTDEMPEDDLAAPAEAAAPECVVAEEPVEAAPAAEESHETVAEKSAPVRGKRATVVRFVAPPQSTDAADAEEPAAEPTAEDDAEQTAAETASRVPLIKGSRTITLVVLVAIVALLGGLLGYWYYTGRVVPQRQYDAAEALYANGQYDEAVAAFSEIRSYSDAASRITEIEYAKADALVDAGSYKDAVEYIDNLSAPTDAMQQLRASAIYQLALQYYEAGDLGNAEGELLLIQDYETSDVSAADLLHEIQYQEASDALAVYDYETAEPILAALGDYEDAAILLEQVQNAIDVVLTDVARDDNGKEIKGKTQYLWVHSVITPGAISADAQVADSEASSAESSVADAEVTAQDEGTSAMDALRALAGATDNVDDNAVHVLMMHMATTDAAMTYEDADPIETDSSTIITKDISSYAAIDDTFGTNQTVYSPQVIQRSNTDYALAFDGSQSYAGKDRKNDQVVMECKMADDGYWVKTRRVYAELEDDRFIGVSKHQLRTWTKVLNESLADEVRAALLANMNGQ